MTETKPDLEALQGLHLLFGQAIDTLQNSDKQYFVAVASDSGPIVVKSASTKEEWVTLINELREEQNNNPNNVIYVQLFEGRHWGLVKGARPGLKCGSEFIALSDDKLLEEDIDHTGSLVASSVKLT